MRPYNGAVGNLYLEAWTMYAIEQRYISYTHPEKSYTRTLPRRYKTARGAEKAAQQLRWICRPNGNNGQPTDESDAVVITINADKRP
jgi:hypothetical protein